MTEDERNILIIIVLIIAAATIYIELRIRRMGVGKKYVASRAKKDQAFNSLHTTKAVRNKLKMDRVNTLKADYMIQRAESAMESGDYEDAMEVCHRAREELLRCKREGDVTPEAEPAQTESEEEEIPLAAAAVPLSRRVKQPETGSSLRLQANFELKAARDDIDAFSGDSSVRESSAQLIFDAERLFETEEYQKSLSNSFRARKMLSGEPIEKEAKPAGEMRIEPPKKADEVIVKPAVGRCNKCGAAFDDNDIFCHACGNPLRPMECAYCGAELKGFEKFCRKCGRPVQP